MATIKGRNGMILARPSGGILATSCSDGGSGGSGTINSDIYLPVGIISMYPDEPWVGGLLANNGEDELLTIGYAVFSSLNDLQFQTSSKITVTAEYDCTVEVYHYTRNIDMGQPHTWESLNGGLCDSTLLGSIALQAGVPGNVSGQNIVATLNAIAAGSSPPYFLFRRSDPSYETMYVWATITVDYVAD